MVKRVLCDFGIHDGQRKNRETAYATTRTRQGVESRPEYFIAFPHLRLSNFWCYVARGFSHRSYFFELSTDCEPGSEGSDEFPLMSSNAALRNVSADEAIW